MLSLIPSKFNMPISAFQRSWRASKSFNLWRKKLNA